MAIAFQNNTEEGVDTNVELYKIYHNSVNSNKKTPRKLIPFSSIIQEQGQDTSGKRSLIENILFLEQNLKRLNDGKIVYDSNPLLQNFEDNAFIVEVLLKDNQNLILRTSFDKDLNLKPTTSITIFSHLNIKKQIKYFIDPIINIEDGVAAIELIKESLESGISLNEIVEVFTASEPQES